mgnify:CR=1 FL=1
MASAKEILDKEIEAFEKQFEELLKHYRGKFVLFKNGKLVDVFTSDAEAFQKGVDEFGDDVFLVRQVLDPKESVVSIPALFAGVIGARS